MGACGTVFKKYPRFEFIHIQRQAGNTPGVQCLQGRCRIQHRTAAGVDQQQAGLAMPKEAGID